MSILNNTTDGLHSLVSVLARTVLSLGPMPREDLLALCGSGTDQAKLNVTVANALRRWTELGLFTESTGIVGLVPEARPPKDAGPAAIRRAIRQAALRRALHADNNADFWAQDPPPQRSGDFTRGLAWWLAQDVYRTDTTVSALLALESSQIGESSRRIVNNDVRMARLREWAQFLGFAWAPPTRAASVVLDPAPAIDWVLDEVLPVAGEEVPAQEFLLSLCHALPVLDGGRYRREVEQGLRHGGWPAPKPGWLSTSLSRALKRLELNGRLTFIWRADVGTAVMLSGQDAGAEARPWDSFTHVVRAAGGTRVEVVQ